MSNATCSIDGCTGKRLARGWCSKHYTRWQKHGDPLGSAPRVPGGKTSANSERAVLGKTCGIDGCGSKHKARGMCSSHLEKWRRFGDPLTPGPREVAMALIAATGKKQCRKCEVPLPLDRFYADSSKSDGLSTYCKTCQRGHFKSWCIENVDVRRDHAHRRRARIVETRVGPIDYDTLWDESNAECGICGHPLSRETPYPDPRFASVDHVVPLSKGGTHTQDNLQYACLSCNVRKHAKVDALPVDAPIDGNPTIGA